MASEQLAIDGGTPVRTERFGNKHIFGEEDLRQVSEVVNTANASWNSGVKVEKFQDLFAQKHNIKYAMATDSGSGALHSAVAALDLDSGDEIITTPVTDIGTVQGILLQNLIPVFADWDPDTFNSDPQDIERRITNRTGAILVVHLFGNPCDMDEILDIGRRHNLPVIEDCAQAHLAEYKGKLVGTMGEMGCFSLGGKMMTTGQGGMIITNNEPLARRAKGHSHKGSEYDEELRESLRPTTEGKGTEQGYSFLGDFHTMSDLQGAIGLAQIQRWQEYKDLRARSAAILDEETFELPGFRHQLVREGNVRTHWFYAFKIIEEEMGVNCEQFCLAMQAEGIYLCSGPYLKGKALYKYPVFSDERTYGKSRYPFVSETGERRIDYKNMHLPVIESELPKVGGIQFLSTFTENDIRDIAKAIRKVALHYSARR